MKTQPLRTSRVVFVALTALIAVFVTVAPAIAERAGPSPAVETTHCVVDVADQTADGELLMSAERCYGSFSEAMLDASDGALVLDAGIQGDSLFKNEPIEQAAAWFTLGVHFDGYGGSGSSLTVKGSSCTGGWWNATGWWRNRISSSYNGCYHLKHHDYPNRAGSTYHTYTKWQIDNIGSWMNNRTESVSYWAW